MKYNYKLDNMFVAAFFYTTEDSGNQGHLNAVYNEKSL